MKNKLFNKYKLGLAGVCIAGCLFATSYSLDRRIVDEKAIYNVVPEVKRVKTIEKTLEDFTKCENLVKNSKNLTSKLSSYSQEYESLMKKKEVIDARHQLEVNKKLNFYSILASAVGSSSLTFAFLSPYYFKKGKRG